MSRSGAYQTEIAILRRIRAPKTAFQVNQRDSLSTEESDARSMSDDVGGLVYHTPRWLSFRYAIFRRGIEVRRCWPRVMQRVEAGLDNERPARKSRQDAGEAHLDTVLAERQLLLLSASAGMAHHGACVNAPCHGPPYHEGEVEGFHPSYPR